MRLILSVTKERGCIEFFLNLTDVELLEWAKLNRTMHEEAKGEKS